MDIKDILARVTVEIIDQSWSEMAGIVILIIAIITLPDIKWGSVTRRFVTSFLFFVGFIVLVGATYYKSFDRGFRKGAEFSTYHTAKLYTAPISVEKLKDNVTYGVLMNMPDRNMSLVIEDDKHSFLVMGISEIPIEKVFVKNDGRIIIQEEVKQVKKR